MPKFEHERVWVFSSQCTEWPDSSGVPQRSALAGRDRALVHQTNIGTVSKPTSGKRLRDGWEGEGVEWSAHGLSRTLRYHLELEVN